LTDWQRKMRNYL